MKRRDRERSDGSNHEGGRLRERQEPEGDAQDQGVPTAPSGMKRGRHNDQDGHAECEVRQIEQRRSMRWKSAASVETPNRAGGHPDRWRRPGRQRRSATQRDLRIRESCNEPYAQRRQARCAKVQRRGSRRDGKDHRQQRRHEKEAVHGAIPATFISETAKRSEP